MKTDIQFIKIDEIANNCFVAVFKHHGNTPWMSELAVLERMVYLRKEGVETPAEDEAIVALITARTK